MASIFNSPDKQSGSNSLARAPVDVDLVRFEKNLLQIGFFGANDTRDKSRTSRRIEQIVTRDGHKVKVAAEFRGSAELGLPSTTDRDKFIALLKIISEERAQTGQIPNPVRFSGYRMIQELGLGRNGEIYEEIYRWGKRMTDTTITSEQVVYFAAKKIYSNEILHVFRNFKRTGSSKLDGAERQEQFEIVLEDWLVENLDQRYVIPKDFNAYKQLTRPTAKGIFGNLHLWFHASQGRAIEKDYTELCNLLNIQTYPHLSKIRSTMGLSLDELIKIGYVTSWDIRKMTTKKGFKIIMTPGPELLRLLDRSRTDRRLQDNNMKPVVSAPEEPIGLEEKEAVRHLGCHGITPATAHSLVLRYGAQRSEIVIEYIESLLRRPSGNKIDNPAGLIIHSLESDIPIPSWFISSRELKEAEAAQDETARQQRQDFQSQYDYKEWLNAQKEKHLAARYSEQEMSILVEQTVAKRCKNDSNFRRWSDHFKRLEAKEILWREISASLELPSLEDWIATNEQPSLF